MHSKKWLLIALAALLLIVLLLGGSHLADYIREEESRKEAMTFRSETFVDAPGVPVSYTEGLTLEGYPADSSVGKWLAGCHSEERNEQFDAYVLHHEVTGGTVTTHTYLIYYRHGAASLTATPTVQTGESGNHRIDLAYRDGDGTIGYALSRLTVTLPADDVPRLRLLHDGRTVDSIQTKTAEAIPEVGT